MLADRGRHGKLNEEENLNPPKYLYRLVFATSTLETQGPTEEGISFSPTKKE